MVKRSKGLFAKRSRNLSRHHRPSAQRVRDVIKYLEIGQHVAIVPKGNMRNIPHPRYKGKIGVITEKRKRGYVVEVVSMGAKRKLVVHASHIEAVGPGITKQKIKMRK
jgi:Ribosomal protein L21E